LTPLDVGDRRLRHAGRDGDLRLPETTSLAKHAKRGTDPKVIHQLEDDERRLRRAYRGPTRTT
jgi:hypothetical protein